MCPTLVSHLQFLQCLYSSQTLDQPFSEKKKTFRDIFKPNDILRNLNLCHGELELFRSEDSYSRAHFRNAWVKAGLVNLVVPYSFCKISLRDGVGWCSHLMALFRSLGSRHMHNLPSGFFCYHECADPVSCTFNWCDDNLFNWRPQFFL